MTHTLGPVEPALYLRRENRFIVIVEYKKKELRSHLPNPGRMVELLHPGIRMYIILNNSKNRKTRATVVALEHDDELIQLHTLTGNYLLQDLNSLERFKDYKLLKTEYTIGNHRFDGLFDYNGDVIIEVKSTTRVIGGIACFPDAISKRAVDHLLHLAQLVETKQVMVIFMIFRQASSFQPCSDIDEKFTKTFWEVKPKLQVVALQCTSKLVEKSDKKYIETNIIEVLPVRKNHE